MRSRTHRRHFGYIVDDRCYYGIPDSMQDRTVVAEWIRIKQRLNQRVTPGVKTRQLVLAVVMRTPKLPIPAARLLARERQYICDRVHKEVGGTMIAQAHLGPTGDTDIHFLSAKKWTRTVRPHVLFRKLFDQIHDELNLLRKQEGRPLLPTMNEARRQKLNARGIVPLAQQLAAVGPLDDTNLADRLSELGHRLGPRGITDRYVEVIHDGGKKPFSYRKDRLLAGQSPASTETDGGQAPNLSSPERKTARDVEMSIGKVVQDQRVAAEVPPFDRAKFLKEIEAYGFQLGPGGGG